MATGAAISLPNQPVQSEADGNRQDLLGLALSAALPLAVFAIANGIAQLNGFAPLFFSPFGLPGWVGAALHMGSLPLFGTARWMVADRGQAGRTAGRWLVALAVGTIIFPFIVLPLDSLMLSIVSMTLLLVGLSATVRTAMVSRHAAMVMLPGLAWMGVSAFVGLSFVAGWSPPFALTNSSSQS